MWFYLVYLLVSKVSPQLSGKNLCVCPYVVCVYIYVCPKFITRKCMEDITDSTGNGCLGKPSIDMLDSSMIKKMAADS